jgi:hypothetical protein
VSTFSARFELGFFSLRLHPHQHRLAAATTKIQKKKQLILILISSYQQQQIIKTKK